MQEWDPVVMASATIGVEAKYGMLGASGTVRTDMTINNLIDYAPYHAVYTTDVWIDFTKSVRLGWIHECNHPVLGETRRNIERYGGKDEVYLRGKFTIKE
jgi:hypothetical protein